jgi:predicted phage tail protein
MKVIFFTLEHKETFNCDIASLAQLLDYCRSNNFSLYERLVKEQLTYTVYHNGEETAYPILPEMIGSSLEGYDVLIIAPKLEGNVSAIAAGILAAFGTTVAAASAVAVAAAYVAAVIIVAGIVVGLGYLIQSLYPNRKLSDGSQDPAEQSRLFNGVPNITEQGGSVPVVVGNCLFGGVRIGLKFEPTSAGYTDVLHVDSFSQAMSYPSSWLTFQPVYVPPPAPPK